MKEVVLLHYTQYASGGRHYGLRLWPANSGGPSHCPDRLCMEEWAELQGAFFPPVTWCWAFSGFNAFFLLPDPGGWRRLINPEEVLLLALPVKVESNWLTGGGRIIGLGDPEPFDPRKHLGKVSWVPCSCGCGRTDIEFWSDYAIAVLPRSLPQGIWESAWGQNPPNMEARLEPVQP